MKKLILTFLLLTISLSFFAQVPTTLTDITPNNCNTRTLRFSYNGGYSLYTGGQWYEYRARTIEVRYYNNSNCNASSGGSGYADITYGIPNWQIQGTGPNTWDFTASINRFYSVEVFYYLVGSNNIHSSQNATFCLSNLEFPPTANGTVNGGASVVCNSSNIILTNTSTGINANSYYKIDGLSMDVTCSYTQGPVNVTSGWKQGNPSSFNLQSELPNPFPNYVGYTKITLTYLTSCGSSSKTFCIQKVNQSIPVGTFQFSVCGGSGVTAPSTNFNSPTSVSGNGGGSIVNTSTTGGGITDHYYKMEVYFWGQWFQIAYSGWLSGTPAVSKTFNSIMSSWASPPVNGYFNNPSYSAFTYRVTLGIRNVCGESSNFGYFRTTDPTCKTDELTTSIQDQESISSMKLYPNPTKGSTTIVFESIANTPSTLSIFDMSGRLVKDVFLNKELGAGIQSLDFDISAIPSGIYVYKLSTDKVTKGTFTKD